MIAAIVRRYFIAFILMCYLAFWSCFVVGLFLMVTGLDLLILWRA